MLYYLKNRNNAAVWRVQPDGGAESIVAESAVTTFGLSQPVSDGIYFVRRVAKANSSEDQVQFFDFATGKTSLIASLPKPATGFGRFGVSPDRRHFLVAQVDRNESDIMLVENFRSSARPPPNPKKIRADSSEPRLKPATVRTV